MTSCPVDDGFDPLAPDYLRDPFAVLAGIPVDETPIFYAPSIGYYVLTRWADIEEVFRDPVTYSAAAAQLPLVPLTPEAGQILLAGGHRPQPSMVSLDPPAHDRLRRPTTRAFTAKRVRDMAPRIRTAVRELLDAGDTSPFELVGTLAFPLPATTIFLLMGVPRHDHERVKRWCGYRALLGWGRPAPGEQVEIATEMVEYRAYLRDLVRDKQDHPGDDIASDLLAIHRENPDRITPEEIASILFSLSFAGHETSTYLIGNTVRRLLEHPARWTALVEDRALIPHAVEEVLRFDTSVPVWRRITTRPARLGGVDLPEGARLFLWLAAAGRDPTRFPEPQRFDLHRPNAADHLAFGKGIHYCLGAGLARTEVTIVLEELLDRYPRLRLVEGQKLTFHPNISFRGPQALWLEHD